MNTEGLGLNREAVEIVKEFVIKKMVMLLADAECGEKIKDDLDVLEKLNIKLDPSDIHPLIKAIQESDVLDEEYEQVRDGQRVEKYFGILADLLEKTDTLAYYDKFSKIKLNKLGFSNFQFVNIALKILDQNNWENSSPKDETQQEIRGFYLDTIMNLGLSGRDKLYNLNILQQELSISLSEQEEDSLIKHIKQNIMGSVDLIDQLKRTAFGVRGVAVDEYSSLETGAVSSSPRRKAGSDGVKKPEADAKKGLFGIFGKK